MQRRLDAVLGLREGSLDGVAHQRHAVQHPAHIPLQTVVKVGGPQLVEVSRQPPHPRADAHLVVVENHQQVFVEPGGVVERLEHDPRRQGPVANHRHAVPTFAQQVIPRLQPQCRRDTGPRVPRHEEVIVALGGIGVAHQAPLAANRDDVAVTAGEQLVWIDLVPGVPDEPVPLEVEHQVQGNGQFDHPQVAGEVSRTLGDHPAQRLAEFPGQLPQLRGRERAQVAGGFQLGEQFVTCAHHPGSLQGPLAQP